MHRSFLRQCQFGVFQYVVIKIIMTLTTFVLLVRA